MKILIYGVGNPGRQDDGLGPAFAERIRDELAKNPATAEDPAPGTIDFDANYQLNVEDAEAISHYDVVLFADAWDPGEKSAAGESGDAVPFRIDRVHPEPIVSFSTHSVSPGGIVALCHHLYGRCPGVYLISLRGYSWEVEESISPRAEAVLAAAVRELAEPVAALAQRNPGDSGGANAQARRGAGQEATAHSLFAEFMS